MHVKRKSRSTATKRNYQQQVHKHIRKVMKHAKIVHKRKRRQGSKGAARWTHNLSKKIAKRLVKANEENY